MKHVLLTYGHDNQVVLRLDTYKLWLKRCTREDFETHVVVFIDDSMIDILRTTLKTTEN